MERPAGLAAAAHRLAQGYRPVAEQAHKVATVVVLSTALTNPTVLAAAAVQVVMAETLWLRPTAGTAAQA
jgi:hypothetical protein